MKSSYKPTRAYGPFTYEHCCAVTMATSFFTDAALRLSVHAISLGRSALCGLLIISVHLCAVIIIVG